MQDEYTIMANRGSLTLGLVGSAIFMLTLRGPGLGRWIGGFMALVFLSCLIHLIWPTPIVRASRDGLYLGIGTFGRSFFVPWERVDEVVLTEVVSMGRESSPRDAIGFVIQQDDVFKLPTLRWNCAGEDVGGVHTDVRFESSMIGGDVKAWVQTIEAFRRDVRNLKSQTAAF